MTKILSVKIGCRSCEKKFLSSADECRCEKNDEDYHGQYVEIETDRDDDFKYVWLDSNDLADIASFAEHL